MMSHDASASCCSRRLNSSKFFLCLTRDSPFRFRVWFAAARPAFLLRPRRSASAAFHLSEWKIRMSVSLCMNPCPSPARALACHGSTVARPPGQGTAYTDGIPSWRLDPLRQSQIAAGTICQYVHVYIYIYICSIYISVCICVCACVCVCICICICKCKCICICI